jgi:hypothetical protein
MADLPDGGASNVFFILEGRQKDPLGRFGLCYASYIYGSYIHAMVRGSRWKCASPSNHHIRNGHRNNRDGCGDQIPGSHSNGNIVIDHYHDGRHCKLSGAQSQTFAYYQEAPQDKKSCIR